VNAGLVKHPEVQMYWFQHSESWFMCGNHSGSGFWYVVSPGNPTVAHMPRPV